MDLPRKIIVFGVFSGVFFGVFFGVFSGVFFGFLTGTTDLTQLAPRLSRYKTSISPIPALFLLFFALLILAFTWKVILYPKFFSSIRHLPRPSGGSFLHGHFHVIHADQSGDPFRRWINEIPNEGLIYYRFLFNSERVLVTSPKGLAEVLVHNNYDFVKPQQLVEGVGRILGVGILLAEGDEHKIQRKNLMPAFHYRHVKDLYAIFWSKSREMTEAITEIVNKKGPAQDVEDGPVLEMGSWASRATLDIIGLAGLGQDFNAIQDPNTELNDTYRIIFGTSFSNSPILAMIGHIFPSWILHRLPFERNIEVSAASIKIRSICRDLVKSKKERMSAQKDSGIDILSVALQSGGFTDENLVDQMMTFLAAGHETTATAMTWAIRTLAQHPAIQSRLRAEIRTHIPPLSDTLTPVTASMLDALPFLQAVCNEILRIKPPVVLTVREAACDTKIQGTFIRKGTRVILSPYAVNMSTSLWGADPQAFNPSRWLGNKNGGAESNYSFMTFLHGPRSCIGQAFAKAEFACLLAAVVGRFEFVLENPDAELKIQAGITSRPRDGVPVKIRVVEGW